MRRYWAVDEASVEDAVDEPIVVAAAADAWMMTCRVLVAVLPAASVAT